MKKILLALAFVSGLAQAQVSGNFGLTSDYRFRGVSQTQNALAVQGGIDYAHESGLYIGNWNSSVTTQLYTEGAGIESDVYAGFKKEINGVTVDVGTLRYIYPRAKNGTATDFDTHEVYGGIGFGPLTAKISQSLGNYFGTADSKGTRYYELNLAQPLAGKLSAVAHVGRTVVSNNDSLNYTDANVGLSYDMDGYVVSGRVYKNTNKGTGFESANTVNGQRLYRDAVVFSVAKTF